MDVVETEDRPVETQAPEEETQSNDASPPSSQERSGPNRLIHQIRSMPLVSLLLGRNVPARNVIHDSNGFFLLKCIMGFHLVILVTLVVLCTFSIYHYNVRFYKYQTRPSETLIVCWLLRGIWRTLNSSWSLRYYCAGMETTPNLKLSQTFYNLVSVLWIGLAVIFLGVSPKEDLKTTSSKICYFLLWTTIASYVVPMLAYTLMCFLLYLTLFIVIYFRHGTIPLTSGAMPLSLLRKLKVQKYREVLKAINMSQSIDKLGSDEDLDRKKATELDLTTPITIDDPLSDCVNNAEMLAERICSICILKINDDDRVFVLPCDMRHLFHRDCLKKWFKRSSECPICRRNISEILAEKDKPVNKRVIEQHPQPLEYSEHYHRDPIQELGQYPLHESDVPHSEDDDQVEMELSQQFVHQKNELLLDNKDGNVDDLKRCSMSVNEANEKNIQSVNSSNGDFIVVVDNVPVDDLIDNGDSVKVGVRDVQFENKLAYEAVKQEFARKTTKQPLNEVSIESPYESSNESPNLISNDSLIDSTKPTSNESTNKSPSDSSNEAVQQQPNQLSNEDTTVQESLSEPDEKLQNTHKQVEKEHEENSEEQKKLDVVVEDEKEEKADGEESEKM